MTPEQRERAGQAVAERIYDMRATAASVAAASDISPNTLRSVIAGRAWPTDAVQARLEAVLRWRPGELVSRAVQGPRALDGFTDAELAEELANRLTERERRESQLRRTDRTRNPPCG